MKSKRTPRRSAIATLSIGVFKTLAFAITITVPLFAVWAASSLAAYWNGPLEATVAAGVVLFPVAPLVWEGAVWWRRRRRGDTRERILTFGDRMILRTLALSTLFLGPALAFWPEATFVALSTRGDWFLADVEGADQTRREILRAADGLAWLYEVAHRDEFARADSDSDVDREQSNPNADDVDREQSNPNADAETERASVDREQSNSNPSADAETERENRSERSHTWPYEDSVHPAVRSIPAESETDVEAVAAYLRSHVADDPFERAKAAHDYVATRIGYDVEAYRSRNFPPQNADSVFTTRRAVCAGYAALFEAIGRGIGLEVDYLSGNARPRGTDAEGESHAWNAVRLDGAWYLVDTTWDAGFVEGDRFHAQYQTLYFLTPSEIFGADHFPSEERWQLRDPPITRGEFNRQPNMSPAFYAQGLRLISPDRSQVDAGPFFEARLRNTGTRFLMAEARPNLGGDSVRCHVTGQQEMSIRCELPRPGTYDVWFYTSPQRFATYSGVGSIQVVRR